MRSCPASVGKAAFGAISAISADMVKIKRFEHLRLVAARPS